MGKYRITSAESMERVIREVGIIPFFSNAVPGYSIEEMTDPEDWFLTNGDVLGPWDWKIDCVQSGGIAYGKFLCGGKASFATVEWYREVMNIRRASLSPDENGRKILAYLDEAGSFGIREVRGLLGVKKSVADAAVGKLQHQCRVVTGDITRVYRGPNLSYKGWQVSSFCSPESLFGDDVPFAGFPGFPFGDGESSLRTENSPEESLELLVSHISALFPSASRDKILRVLK